MPKVLVVAAQDPSSELGSTPFYRSDVERLLVTDVDTALGTAKLNLPNLVLIKDQLPFACEKLARQIRSSRETRRASIVVLLRPGSGADEAALERAGVNLVISGPLDLLQWEDRLEELLSEPRRRDAPVAVSFVVWPGASDQPQQ